MQLLIKSFKDLLSLMKRISFWFFLSHAYYYALITLSLFCIISANMKFVNRIEESEILRKALNAGKTSFVVVYGRADAILKIAPIKLPYLQEALGL